mmetsp:Transcript_125288/g.365963  ORF Transcript_125288/g.365963 Transcript_125288/m.365963 type:complete len:88 (-) Transcript_125288:779-1042(-)
MGRRDGALHCASQFTGSASQGSFSAPAAVGLAALFRFSVEWRKAKAGAESRLPPPPTSRLALGLKLGAGTPAKMAAFIALALVSIGW